MKIITNDMIISEILMMDKETATIFVKHGMYCLGCPSSSGESIQEACAVHGIDAAKLLNDLNEYFNSRPKEEDIS